ncbi:MAG TPA: MotE family protein [Caulobacteraceae bacterium]|jgi:flagellar motility protein MotE (MotC chaperone)|nr:MotE family protein [Caulobacteraceae bacterium]
MKMPRIMPLVAIAAGGVLAINAVENGPGIIGAARSFAEAAPKPAPAKSAIDAATNASATTAATAMQAVTPKPAPICAESPAQLAKDAGLSPAELQVIQSLGARRGELDQREQGLSTQLALIQAAEAKVDQRIATMNALKADMQGLLGQLDDKRQAEVDRLVKVYEAMKPQDSAARFVLLTDEVRLPIAAKMKERVLSAMIAKMPPPEAKRLTEALAARYISQAAAAKAAINPPPLAAAAPPPAAAKPAPPQLAQATAVPADPAAKAAAAVAAPPKPKPAAPRKPKKPIALAAGTPPKSSTPWAMGPGKPVAAPATPAAAAIPKPAATAAAAAPAPKPALSAQAAPPTAAAATPAAPTPAKPPTPSATATPPAKTG